MKRLQSKCELRIALEEYGHKQDKAKSKRWITMKRILTHELTISDSHLDDCRWLRPLQLNSRVNSAVCLCKSVLSQRRD